MWAILRDRLEARLRRHKERGEVFKAAQIASVLELMRQIEKAP